MTTSKTDKIAYLEHSFLGTSFSATLSTREKDVLCADKVPTAEAAIAALLKHAPPNKVPTVYIHMGCAKYGARVDILKAVESAGYKPHVLGNGFDSAVFLSQSGVKCKTGELVYIEGSIGYHPSLGHTQFLFRKTENEFELFSSKLPDFEKIFSTNLKHVLFDSAITDAEPLMALNRKVFKKACRSVTLVDRPLSTYLWDIVDHGYIKGYRVRETCGMGFNFFWHKDNKERLIMTTDFLPTKKSVRIDLKDAGNLLVYGGWLEVPFDLIKTYVFKEPANRIVEITISFGDNPMDPLPKLDIVVVERTSISNHPIFFEFVYDAECKAYAGTYVSDKRLHPVAYNVKTPAEVFNAMKKHAGTIQSMGVKLTYSGLHPFKIHNEVIAALPTPHPKVCCNYTQYYLSMSLRLSGIKLNVDEYVVLAIRRPNGSYYEFGVLQKTANGFKGIGTGYSFSHGFNFQKVVIVVENGIKNCCHSNVTSTFPGKELIIADWAKAPEDCELDFARHYFTEANFYGYMVEEHLGMKFIFEAGGKSVEIDKTFEWVFSNHVEELPIGNEKCSAKLKFTFYGRPDEHFVKSIEVPAGKGPRSAVLTLSVDCFLVPTAEIKIETTSIPSDFLANAFKDGTLKFFVQSSDAPVVYAPCTTDEKDFTMLVYYTNMTAPLPDAFPSRAAMYAQIAADCKTQDVIGVVDQYPDNFTVSQRRHRQHLLDQANLPNVKTVNGWCLHYSLHLTRANANQYVSIGETAIVMCHEIAILKRTAKGYQLLDISRRDILELCNEHRTNFVVLFTMDDHIPQAIVDGLKQRLAPRKFVVSDPARDSNFLPQYYHSFYNGGTFDGYKVADFLNFEFTVTFGNEKRVFKTGYVSWPHNLKVEIDIGEAMSVEVAAMSVADFQSIKPEVVKTFKMKTKERRLVALTMQILHPYNLTASMAVLERGTAPQIVLIHRQLDGYCQTVLTEKSLKVDSDVYPTIEAAMQSCESPNGCSVVIDVALATFDQRTALFALAKELGYGMSLGMHSICLDVNKLLFSYDGFECNERESVFLTDMSTPTGRSYVIRRDHTGYHLVRASKSFEKLRNVMPSIRRAFIAKNAESIIPAVCAKLDVVVLSPVESADSAFYKFLASSIASNALSNRPYISNFTGIVFTAKWGKKSQNVEVGFASVPYSDIVVFHVGTAENLKINMTSLCSSKSELVKQFNFRSPANRVLVVKLAVDRHLEPSATLIRADRVPTVGLTFTTDNRVLIRAGADYTGDDSIPAYLSYTDEVKVGTVAQEHLKTCPEAVVYDIVRLLANDFDPAVDIDPSWQFRVWREDDNGIMVEMGEKRAYVTTLFAVIIKCTLLYIKQHYSRAIEDIGIQLPMGSVISENMRCDISERLGVNLIIYYY